MKRWLAKIVVFLIIGAGVSVAVAWTCVIVPIAYTSGEIHIVDRGTNGSHTVHTLHGFGSEQVMAILDVAARGYEYMGIPTERTKPSPYDWSELRQLGPDEFGGGVEDARGWPMLCFRAGTGRAKIVGGLKIGGSTPIRLVLATGRRSEGTATPRVIPFIPIWRGLAFNSCIYATLTWLLVHGSLAVRRFIRHKRGRCIKCGYDLRGTAHMICSECGYEVGAEAGT